ncbi:Endoprotease bli-4, partial [Trichinella nelsoni]
LMFKIVILLWLWQQMVASGPSDGDFSNIGNVTSNVVVQLQFDDSEHADIVANKHGYKNMGKVGSLKGVYWFKKYDHYISKREIKERLDGDPEVLWHEFETPKKRVKRDGLLDDESNRQSTRESSVEWPDPLYSQQWYLNGFVGDGMRVREAWSMGYSGKNVVVSILDDGIQGDHPDLAANYDAMASHDVNDGDDNPYPRDNGDNRHGTRCAGEVAAVAGNSFCGVGVAYNARIGGVRMLDGPVSDRVEGSALSLRQQHIDIYSASWGPEDDGKTFDGPGRLAKMAFYQGVTEGRNGKGNIYIWASGNGGTFKDSCSCDGYTVSIYTLSVSSTTFDHKQPWYLEECPSTLASTYSSGLINQPAIVTTDMPNTCTTHHTGTSASAPIAAGIVALVLEANSNLTWRDMQHLVVRTSDPTPLLNNPGWIVNGVGRKVSSKFGYGIMNAEKLIRLGKKWKTVPTQHVCTFVYEMPDPILLNGQFLKNITINVNGCPQGAPIRYLEHVQLVMSVQFSRRGDLRIRITSPSGTESELLPPRLNDGSDGGFIKWPFMSVQQWGENPEGKWIVTLENVGNPNNRGTFHDCLLTLYGTEEMAQPSELEMDDELGKNSRPALFGTSNFVSDLAGHQELLQYYQIKSVFFTHVEFGIGVNFGDVILKENCHPECENGCRMVNSSLDCVSCKHYYQELRNRGGSKCVSKCEPGYYLDTNARRCNLCLRGCATCSSATLCDTCLPSMFLIVSDPEHLWHGKCETECPDGFLAEENKINGARRCLFKCDEGCLNCTAEGPCRFCKFGYFLNSFGHCVKSCGDGYYDDVNKRKCVKCPQNCEQCSKNANICQVCKFDYALNSVGQCEPQKLRPCDRNEQCPLNSYCEKSGHVCQACHPDCAKCIGPGFDQCTLCKDGQAPNPKSNDCSCKRGYYFNAKFVTCEKCHIACAVCNGPGTNFCSECNPGYSLLGSSCIRCCGNNESSSRFCIRCLGSFTSNQYSIKTVVIGSCIGAAILFIVIFGALMTCDWYRKSRNAYEYSNVPIYFNSDSVKLLENEYDEKFEEHDNQLSHVQDDSDVVIDVLMERA